MKADSHDVYRAKEAGTYCDLCETIGKKPTGFHTKRAHVCVPCVEKIVIVYEAFGTAKKRFVENSITD